MNAARRPARSRRRHELKQQHDVQHVQQHVGDMEAERRRAPERAVERVREVDDGRVTSRSTTAAQIERRPQSSGSRRPSVVVVDERVVERVDVDETGEEHGNADRQSVIPAALLQDTFSQSRGIVYDCHRRMPPLRILHVTPYSADAWAYGGIPRLVSDPPRGLARRGHTVTVARRTRAMRSSRLKRSALARSAPGRRPRPPTASTCACFPTSRTGWPTTGSCSSPLGFDGLHARARAATSTSRTCMRAATSRARSPRAICARPACRTCSRRTARRRASSGGCWPSACSTIVGQRGLRDAARVLAVSDAERRQLRALGVPDESISRHPQPGRSRRVQRRRSSAAACASAAPLWARSRSCCSSASSRRASGSTCWSTRSRSSIDPDAPLVIAGNDMGRAATVERLVRALGLEPRVALHRPAARPRAARSARRRRRRRLSVAGRDLRPRAARSAALRHTGRRRRRFRLRRGRPRDWRQARSCRPAMSARWPPRSSCDPGPERWRAEAAARRCACGNCSGTRTSARSSWSSTVRYFPATRSQLWKRPRTCRSDRARSSPQASTRSSASSSPSTTAARGSATCSRASRAGRRPADGDHRRRRSQRGRTPAILRDARRRPALRVIAGPRTRRRGGDQRRHARGAVPDHLPGRSGRRASARLDARVWSASSTIRVSPPRRATTSPTARRASRARVMGLDLEQRYARDPDGRTTHVCTGNSAYRAEALRQVGLFDESSATATTTT